MEIRTLDTVVLVRDLSQHGLWQGDLGAVVEILSSQDIVVEFVTGSGHTQALVTLSPDGLRPLADVPQR